VNAVVGENRPLHSKPLSMSAMGISQQLRFGRRFFGSAAKIKPTR
jgi:hypothetical protein